MSKCALVMAGGTGGHIFPGLAVAEALRERGWRVHWLGNRSGMEGRLVPPRGFAFESIDFGGVRGKGPLTLAFLPLRLLKAFWQSIQVVRRVKPDVLIGLGGYISPKDNPGKVIEQSPEAINTIALVMVAAPIAAMLLGLLAAWGFRLNARTHAVLVHEVERLRAGATQAESEESRKIVEDLTGWKFSTLWGRGR